MKRWRKYFLFMPVFIWQFCFLLLTKLEKQLNAAFQVQYSRQTLIIPRRSFRSSFRNWTDAREKQKSVLSFWMLFLSVDLRMGFKRSGKRAKINNVKNCEKFENIRFEAHIGQFMIVGMFAICMICIPNQFQFPALFALSSESNLTRLLCVLQSVFLWNEFISTILNIEQHHNFIKYERFFFPVFKWLFRNEMLFSLANDLELIA